MNVTNAAGRWLFVLGLLAGCNETDFAGSNKVAPSKPSEDATEIPCDTTNPNQKKHIRVETNDAGSQVKVSGTFCAVGQDQTAFVGPHIAFLVDYSGSMRIVDPLKETCMRYEAAKALYDSLESRFADKMDKITFSLTTFDGTALAASGGVISAQEFKDKYLKKEILCMNTGGGTNYEAAFTVVHDQVLSKLNNAQDKHLFMLTDGVPTMLGPSGPTGQCDQNDPTDLLRCEDAGAAAADKMRADLQNFTFNVLFLVNQSNQAESELAKSYLEQQVTKNPDNVKFAGNAKEAAALIKEFDEPQTKEIPSVDATAKIEGDLNVTPMVKLENKGNGVWSFETLVMVPGKPATYVLKVVPTAAGTDLGMSTEVEIEVVVVDGKAPTKP